MTRREVEQSSRLHVSEPAQQLSPIRASPRAFSIDDGFRNGPQGDDGFFYTGTADGLVYRLDPDGGNPTAVFFTGGVVCAVGRAVGSTTGVDYGNRLRHECHEKVIARATCLDFTYLPPITL